MIYTSERKKRNMIIVAVDKREDDKCYKKAIKRKVKLTKIKK